MAPGLCSRTRSVSSGPAGGGPGLVRPGPSRSHESFPTAHAATTRWITIGSMIVTPSPSPIASPSPVAVTSSALDWVTLGIAVLGLSVAALSLGWQIVEWLLSGSRVKPTIGFALSVGGPTHGARMLSIAASNTGRSRASITSWAIMLPDKRTIVPQVDPGMWQGPDVPIGLDVGDGASWFVLLGPMIQARRDAGYRTETEVRATLVLGTGKRKTSRKGVRI